MEVSPAPLLRFPPDISVENTMARPSSRNHVTSKQQRFVQPKHEQHRLKSCHKLLFIAE